jgi:ribose 5-phosphate isomerase B
MPKLRIVVGADDAGFAYKEALKADLQADDRVESVVDVAEILDHPYPNEASASASKVELISAYEGSRPRSTV